MEIDWEYNAKYLWRLLNEIGAINDTFPTDNRSYRACVEGIRDTRWKILDGCERDEFVKLIYLDYDNE